MKTIINHEAIKILIVEDNEDDLFFIKKALSGQNFEISIIESGIDAYNYLLSTDNKPDIVLLDNKLPGMDGIEILQKICKETNDYSFIFLTVDNTIAIVVEAMKAGALDFIVKSSDLKNELPLKINKVYEIHKTKIEKKQIEQELISAKAKTEENEKKYKILFNTITAGVALNEIVYNDAHEMVDYKILEVNDAYYTTADYNSIDVINNLATEIYGMSPDFIKVFWINHKKHNETAYTEMYSPITKRCYYISTSPFVNDRFVTVFFDISDIKNTEKELIHAKEQAEKNEEKYKNAVTDLNKAQSVAKVGSWKWYIIENRVEWSKEMYQIFGIDEKEFTGDLQNIIQKAIHPDDVQKVEESNKSADEKGSPIPLEYRIILPDRTIKTVWAEAGELIKDKNSQPTILSGIVQDITDRKKSELEIISKTKTLQSVFESAPYIMLLVNHESRVTDINRVGISFTGKKKEDIIGLLGGEVFSCINALNGQVCGQGRLCEFCPIRNRVNQTFQSGKSIFEGDGKLNVVKNGINSVLDILISTTMVQMEDNKLVLVTIADISERFRIEETLRQSEDNYHRFMDESTLGIRIINTAGTTMYVNKALLNIYGLDSFQEYKDIPVSKRYTARELINHQKRKIERKNNQNISSDYEIEINRKDGEIRYLQVLRKEIIWDKSLHYQIIYQDITDRKKAEAELIIAKEKAEESDRLKTAFLQNMSHEIRTPMNAINGFSGMLNKPGISDEKRNSFISIIKSSSSQLLSIVTDILTISSIDTKQEKLDIQPVCINSIIIDLLAIFKTQLQNQNVSLFSKQQLPDKESEIYTDKTKLNQILTNLIANALKFTHEGIIEFGYNLDIVVEMHGRASLQYLLFYVKDTGIGIKSELHNKIFERFRQAELSISRKYGGTGLGLSISKGYVELMGGKIWLESELGKGSTFYFTIPYEPVSSKTTKLDKVTLTDVSTVLVAEDEEYNYLFIEEILNELGLNIIHAKNGIEAIEFCKTNLNIGLVLMDIKMPLIDGHIAAIEIKKFRPDLPLIAQTAYALEFEKEKYQDAFNDYITKPVDENELREKINKYISLHVKTSK